MESQVSTKPTPSPQATPPSITAPTSALFSAQRRPVDPSSAAMGKETLYSDGRGGEISPFAGSIETMRHSGQGRGGTVHSRYGGDMEILYNDRHGRSGMAFRRYGGDIARFTSKRFSWQDRKKDGKNPFATVSIFFAVNANQIAILSVTAIKFHESIRRSGHPQFSASSPRQPPTTKSTARSMPSKTATKTHGYRFGKTTLSPT